MQLVPVGFNTGITLINIKKMKKIIVFASGSGTNVQNITEYFMKSDFARVILLLTNNPKAYVIERAIKLNIPYKVFNRDEFSKNDNILNFLISINPDLIVLAGFLWLIPAKIINAFQGKIINIHPALLPKYGGKGMYGIHVHESVIANREKQSGITIHSVNEHYDDGAVIFQVSCEIKPEDTPTSLAEKIHLLEQTHYPKIIQNILEKQSYK